MDQMKLLLDTIATNAELCRAVDACLAATGSTVTVQQIPQHAGYADLTSHKKIDAFTYIPFAADPRLANASDFSQATIEERIEAGYQEAIRQRIWEPRYVQSAEQAVGVPPGPLLDRSMRQAVTPPR